MAGANQQFMAIMNLLGLLLLSTFDSTEGQAGVCYGGLGSASLSSADVVALCNRNNIKRMRIYDPDQSTLQALGGSNIELILGVPNDKLRDVAESQDAANSWVQDNVKNYPNVNFRYIAVGNEVSPLTNTSQYTTFVLPALQNIFTAISAAGLGNRIRISTVVLLLK